jgi:hypothetical protein
MDRGKIMVFILDEQQQPDAQPRQRFVLQEAEEPKQRGALADIAIQGARGLARAFTYPADLVKLAARGATLEVLKDERTAAVERGEDFDVNSAFAIAQKGLDLIPTQELVEKGIESVTGVDLEPVGAPGRIAGTAGELIGFTPKTAGSLLRRAGGAVVGAGVEEGLEQLGVPAPIAGVAGIGVGGLATSANLGTRKLATGSAGLEARQTAERFGLRKFAGAELEQPIKKIVRTSEARIAGLKGELAETSKQAIDGILEKRFPAKELQNKGHSLRELASESFDNVEKLATENLRTFSTEPITKNIEKKMKEIALRAPSLSKESKDVFKLYSENLEAFKGLEMDSTIGVAQFREWNKDLGSIYKRAEFSGSQGAMADAYAGLKKDMVKLLEKNNGKEFIEEFRYSNSLYSQDKSLQRAENILEKAFADGFNPKKLSKSLQSKEGKFLKRDLGAESFNDIMKIAKFGERANEFVLNNLKKRDFGGLSNVLKGSAAAFMLSNPLTAVALKSGVAIALPKAVWNGVNSRLMTRNSTRKALVGLNTALATGTEASIARASNAFNKSIEKEFGSLDNIMTDIEGDFLD